MADRTAPDGQTSAPAPAETASSVGPPDSSGHQPLSSAPASTGFDSLHEDDDGDDGANENLGGTANRTRTQAIRRTHKHGGWTLRRILLLLCLAVAAFILWFIPPVYKLINGPVVVTRYEKKIGESKATVGPNLSGWITTKKISRHALNAIIAAEDGKFYEHHGFDFGEIKKSVALNMQRKKFARGASTISQQVVKMAFLGREKTLLRKAREAAGTVLMELILPKDKILEWYINLAEFGDGVYGVQAGCWHYFKTKPEALSIEQAVHLALVLPSPNAWSRGLRQRNLTSFGHKRFAAILNRMRQSGDISKAQWTTGITRGDFGRPINGYAKLIAADEQKKQLCPGSPGCPEAEEEGLYDGEADELTYPRPGETAAGSLPPATAPATAVPTVTSSPGAVGRADTEAVPPPASAPPATAPPVSEPEAVENGLTSPAPAGPTAPSTPLPATTPAPDPSADAGTIDDLDAP